MGIIQFLYSYKKSIRINKLQLKLYPPEASIIKMYQQLIHGGSLDERNQLLDDYYNLCYGDENVKAVMKEFELDRIDFDLIHKKLI